VCGCPKGLFDAEILASFFLSFYGRVMLGNRRLQKEEFQLGEMSHALSMDSEGNSPLTIPYPWRFAQSVQVERVVLNALEMRLHGFAIVSPRRADHQRACRRTTLWCERL
jgi:hypothetical protein